MIPPTVKKWIWPRHLRNQIILLLAVVFLATTAIFSWQIASKMQENLQEFLHQYAVATTLSLTIELAQEVYENDLHGIEQTLLSLRTNNDVERILFTDVNGEVITSYNTSGDSPEFLRQKSGPIGMPAEQKVQVNSSNGLTTVWAPVVFETLVGWLIVDYRFHHFNEIRSNVFVSNMKDGIAIIIAASLIFLFLIKKPILSLRRAAAFAGRMDELRGERLDLEGGSIEVERLINSLNNASSKLYRQEREVKKIQQRLVRAKKLARLGVWEWNVSNGELYWLDENSEVHYQYEQNFEAAISHYLLASVHDDDKENVKNQIISAMNDRYACAFDYRVINNNGETRVVHHQVDISCDNEGKVALVLGTTQDVTELKRSELEIKKRNKQILNILESTTDGYFSVDEEWRVQYMNSHAEQLLLIKRDGILGEIIWDVIPELASSFYKPMHASLFKNKDLDFIVGFYPPAEKWLEMHCYSHGDGLSAYFRDVTEGKLASEALRQSEAQARIVLDNVLEAVISIDRYGNITTFNKSAENIFGYKVGEVIGHNITMLMPGEYASNHHSYINRYVFTGEARLIGLNRELLGMRKNGETFPVEIDLSEVHISDQPYFVGIVRDLTLRKEVEQNMRLSEQVFSSSVEGIIVFDSNKKILRVNNAFSKITGYDETSAIGLQTSNIFDEEFESGVLSDVWYEVDRYGAWQGELKGARPDRRSYLVWLSLSVTKDESGKITNYIAIFNDLTEIKEAQSRIHHLANFDALTSLPNRVLFQQKLNQSLLESVRSGAKLLLLRIDLDRFKTINDTLGHAAGDMILQKVAEQLKEETRPTDTVARLSGDEFAICCTNLTSESDVAAVARKLLASFDSPIHINSQETYITVSIGGTVYPEDGTNADDLIRRAGKAMQHVKESGRNSFRFYTHDLDEQAFEKLILENSLRRALERKEFVLHYQPQVDLLSGKVIGVEALIRWNHPELGMVSPAMFIPMLEESGMIVQVGEWVMVEACRQCSEWHKAGYDGIRMAVNLSPRQFEQQGLTDVVDKALLISEMDPMFLELEITESSLMKNADQNVKILSELKEKNIDIAIDDFGTGYSSLSYLTRFPVDTLKIDRSFVMDVTEDPNDAALAKAIISMAHSLKIKVLAEGVETLEQLEFLRRHDCDEIQGFYFSKPLPAEEVLKMFSAHLSLPKQASH